MIGIGILIVLFCLLTYGIGKRFSKWGGISFHSDGEEIVFSIALGLVCFSYLLFVLGLFRLLYIEVFYPLIGILLIILFPEVKRFITTIPSWIKGFWNELKTNKVTIYGIILLIYLGITFIRTFAPPIDFDSTMFHLIFPKLSVQQHDLSVTPYNLYYNILIQLLYLPGFMLKEEASPHLFQWLMSSLTIWAIYLFMRKYFSVTTGIWAGLIFLTNPIVLVYSTIASVDMSLCFYLFLTTYALFEWFSSKDKKWLWLSGAFGGCSLGIKYSAFVFLCLLVIGFFLKKWLIDRERFISTLKWTGIFIGVAFLLSLPWYLRGYFYTGNPIFPMFSTIWVGIPFNKGMTFTVVAKELINYFLFPWHITLIKLEEMECWDSFSPLLLTLIPCLVFFLKGINQIAKYLILYCWGVITVFFYLSFSLSPQCVRYMMPLLPWLSILAAYASEKLIIQNRLTQKIVSSIFALVLAMNFILLGALLLYHLPTALGLESRDQFLSSRIDIYPACHYINTHPDKIQTVLILDERGYYCDLPHIIGLPVVAKPWVIFHKRGYINPYWIDYWSFKNSDEMLKRFKELNISHILINYNCPGINDKNKENRPFFYLFNELKGKQQLELIFSDNNVFLYNIRYR